MVFDGPRPEGEDMNGAGTRIDFKRNRERMVREQIEGRGVTDPEVLRAMRKIPRHLFVDEALIPQAYENHPLPLGHGQTISQPYVVALMSQLLEAAPGMKVLEIGTGSGYQAAVLSEMGLDVYSVERMRDLHLRTSALLRKLRYFHIACRLGDGTLGWPEEAPFERILVTAGGPFIPEPLLDQLADPGILLMPVGARARMQNLVRVHRQNGEIHREDLGAVSFVDLVGNHGW